MSTKPAEVSVFEAKTRLSELLRGTEAGRSFVIRRHGKVVARLTPAVQKPRVTEMRGLWNPSAGSQTSHWVCKGS